MAAVVVGALVGATGVALAGSTRTVLDGTMGFALVGPEADGLTGAGTFAVLVVFSTGLLLVT